MSKWVGTGKYKYANKVLDMIGVILFISIIIITLVYWVKASNIVPIHYNANGQIDGYGSKNTTFFILALVSIVYIFFHILGKNPETYNYAIKITPKNKEKQYNMAAVLVRTLKIEILLIFLYIKVHELVSLREHSSNLSKVFITIESIIILGTLGFYVYKSYKNK